MGCHKIHQKNKNKLGLKLCIDYPKCRFVFSFNKLSHFNLLLIKSIKSKNENITKIIMDQNSR